MTKHVIYHGGCADGFTSAWLLQKDYEDDVVLYEGVYGEDPPDVIPQDAHVIIADFSYPRDKMVELAGRVSRLTVLDHHKTAQKNLEGLDSECDNVEVVFDMDRSGAGIVWDWVGQPSESERLVSYVQDRDLWEYELDNSEYVGEVILATPFYMEDWEDMNVLFNTDFDQVISMGRAIRMKCDKVVDEIVKTAREVRILDHEVLMAASPYSFGSTVAGQLALDRPFGVYYIDHGTHRQFGLRSRDGGEDVSEIAEVFGGGGHRNASGFTVEPGHELFYI